MKVGCSPRCTKNLRQLKHEGGPCPTCGKMFIGRKGQLYCGLSCYVKDCKYRAYKQKHPKE